MKSNGLERRARPLLGTFVEIALRPAEPEAFTAAFAEISRIQALMSAHAANSDLADIARTAHHGSVEVDPATAEVISKSLRWAAASGGAFDPVHAGVELVHGGRRPWFAGALPDRAATWRDLEIEGTLVRSSRPLALDLGGVAKGFAVDRAVEILAAAGCSGVVNAGGDLRFFGDGERVAHVKQPERRGALLELREIPFPALATTGSYEFSDDGSNLDLIARAPLSDISITVFAATCMLADAMTKVVLNLGPAEAGEVLRRSGCTALVLESGGRCREIP